MQSMRGEDRQLGFGQRFEHTWEAPIFMGHFELIEQAWHAFVENSDTVSTGGLRQGAGQPGYPRCRGQ